MNHTVVTDASVTVGRLLQEEFTAQARAFFVHNLDARRPIVAPPHLPAEVSNAIYQRLRRRREPRYYITEAEADAAFGAFLALPILTVSPPGLYQAAYDFAKQQGIASMYDSLYVVLARMLEVELWTGDVRLYNATRNCAPWVRFIGDYSLA